MLIYSPDNRTRAKLTETPAGVAVEFAIFRSLADQRGLNISNLDPGDLPPSCVWQQGQATTFPQPFHVVRDRVYTLLHQPTSKE